MNGNMNRCIKVARGEWITILHDDDMIDPGFAREMLGELLAHPAVDGLVCRKRSIDQRAEPYRASRARNWLSDAVHRLAFGLGPSRTITASKLFWGCITGNTVGFVFRTADGRAIGGLQDEEYPSSDYFFYASFADRLCLRQSRKTLATIRVAANMSMSADVNLLALRRGYELQRAYVGARVPRMWRALSPLLMARQIAVTARVWRTDLLPKAGHSIGIAIPRDRPMVLYMIRLLLGGF